MTDKWWSDEVVAVDFIDNLWGVEAQVGDDPEVGITVELRFPNDPERRGYTLGEQDVLDILAAMNDVRRSRNNAA